MEMTCAHGLLLATGIALVIVGAAWLLYMEWNRRYHDREDD